MNNLLGRIKKISNKYNQLLGERKTLKNELLSSDKKLKIIKEELSEDEKVLEILYTIADVRKGDIKDKIEELVTKGIRSVFDRDDLKFELKMKISRGDVAIDPVIISKYDGEEFETDIVQGHGGGVADIVSFILRVVVLSLIRPPRAKILVLDEPFKHVSQEYLEPIAELIKDLHKITGLQIVMVTHKTELIDSADVVYKSRLNDKKQTILSKE